MTRTGRVNDGSIASGQEVRNVDLLEGFLGSAGFDAERFEMSTLLANSSESGRDA